MADVPADTPAAAADPVIIPTDPAQVTAAAVRAVWDEEGAEGVADWVRAMARRPALGYRDGFTDGARYARDIDQAAAQMTDR